MLKNLEVGNIIIYVANLFAISFDDEYIKFSFAETSNGLLILIYRCKSSLPSLCKTFT